MTADDFSRSDREIEILGDHRRIAPATVQLTLPPFEDVSWRATVWFFEDEYNEDTFDVEFGLLGTAGFLDQWVVTFNFRDNYFVVETRDDFVERLPIDPFIEFQRLFDDDWTRPKNA